MKTRKLRRRPDASRREAPFFSRTGEQSGPETSPREGFFQPKLTIGKPGDRFEQEADRTADAVVNRTRSGSTDTAVLRKKAMLQRQPEPEEDMQTKLELQRQTDEEEESVQTRTDEENESIQTQADEEEESVQTQADEEEEPVQTQSTDNEDRDTVQAKSQNPPNNTAFATKLKQQQGKGRPLPPRLQAEMEATFDADFSAVRIHTGEEAAELSKMLGAQAFTRGNDIFFNEGKFDPRSSAGKHLLAHELTHNRQQRKK